LIAVREEIEAASQLNVVTDIGDWIKPDRWSGVEVLDALRGDVEQRDAVLRTLNFGDTGALRRAQALWVEGVIEHDMRNFGQAIELFLAARRYVEVYKLYAVKTVYTVRLIPERRDCLWRIAEYDFIYDDPFLWPKIWRRNRDLIQNPDLIHPGWQLIIPAL
jgi:nucleoid-associated protein YgaU